MSEVKPWMRRAANESVLRAQYGSDEFYQYDAQISKVAQSIAAHAPPVDALVAALRFQKHKSPGLLPDCLAALETYDSWLAKQEEK